MLKMKDMEEEAALPVSERILTARRRVEKLSTSDLYEWAEQCQYAYGKTLTDQRSTDDPEASANMLEEAILAAEVCRVIAEEIQVRTIR